MTLTQLFELAGVQPDSLTGDAAISGVCLDSRRLRPGDLFVCMPGHRADSHSFLESAKAGGASAAVVHSAEGLHLAESLLLPSALIDDRAARWNRAVAALAKSFFGNPTRDMKVVGLTGTNGKTTTAHIVHSALQALGYQSSYIGTLGVAGPKGLEPGTNTTPLAIDLMRTVFDLRSQGANALAIEISSHALTEFRADGLELDVGVFTNLTQDHMDFHLSMESYSLAKRRLFTELPSHSSKDFVAAINVDDPTGEAWAAELPNVVAYSIRGHDAASLNAKVLNVGISHIDLEFGFEGSEATLHSLLGGLFNVQNLAAGAAALVALGHPLEDAVRALSVATPVPGRFETIANDRGIGVIVDYAHTPDALENLLRSVRSVATGRVIVVFGCGGDRDRSKRPLMAQAVLADADFTIITTDNPRTENPSTIFVDILSGVPYGSAVEVIEDREAAIIRAIDMAETGDVVVIAGKGHEPYQIIGDRRLPFDDREVAREVLYQGVHS